MRFHLDEQQVALQDTVDRCLTEVLDQQRLLAALDGTTGFDSELWSALGEVGVLGVMVPEAYGGTGVGLLETALVAEVLGRHATPGPWLGHQLSVLAIAAGGTPEQQERWLPRLASGDAIGTVALGEAGGHWQPEQWRLAAEVSLSGGKVHVPYPALADLMVVGVADGGLMLVEDTSRGMEIESLPCLDATRRTAHVWFAEVPAQRLSCTGARLRDAALVLLAADAFGGARRCVDMAVRYALEREQFGSVIGRFQALKHQLADMATEVEPARALYWYAAHAFDDLPEEAPRAAALAKAHVCDRFVQAARDATEVHGGIGYTWEYPLHVWLKRAVFDRAFMGSPTVHRQRSAALAGWEGSSMMGAA
jgi:alkylation response protein AidB-like acyl-CoA dehydrogenase